MNSTIKTRIFIFSGIFVLIGAILYLNRWEYAPYVFATGAAGITICYMTIPYQTLDYRMRRLYRMNVLAGILMVVASAFMFKQRMEWVVCLLISAILQCYTSFVIKEKGAD